MVAAAPRSIEIVFADGSKGRVDNIPGNAKITVGPLSPGSRDYTARDIALRIYTSANNQLAVFRNVQSFRDLSLALALQKIVVNEAEHHESGARGSKSKQKQDITFEWETA